LYSKDFILVGSIVGLHGLKGYFKVKSFLENPKDIFKFGEYFIDKLSFSSILFKFNKKSVFICELEGINSIEEAKKFVNKDIFICRLSLPEIDEDEIYLNDLISFNVELETGLCLGELIKFYDFGGGPIIAVKHGNEEKMLPFSKNFIINIDRDLRLITLSSSIKTLIN
jgi:16S rRNA processing protein RimM